MRVVFDKKNAISFFKQIDQDDAGDDILRLLKRQMNLQFNFKLDKIEEALEFQILEFEEAGGRGDKNLTIVYKDERNESEVFCLDNINNDNNIYLLTNISNRIKNANKVLIGELGQEIEILKKLFLDLNDVSTQEIITIGSDEFRNWRDIEAFAKPFSTILIIDRYMFKGPEIGGNYGLFDYNLKVILGMLFKNHAHRATITFVYQINPFPRVTSPQHDSGPNLDSLKRKVKQAIKSSNSNCPVPDINFIAVPKGRIQDDHDRNIITNYIRIKSGDTFIYFNSNGDKITNSNDFDVYSLARSKYRVTTTNLVNKLNEIVNETVEKYEEGCLLSNPEKKRNIINF